MTLLWPWMAFVLLVPAGAVVAYVFWLRRKRRSAVRFPSLSLVREALGKQSRWRRHVPFALLIACTVALAMAMTRPQAIVQVERSRTSIILTFDVSRSMCATDIEPNRLTVAQQAAVAFIDDQPEGTQIGIVAFAGFTELAVPPTRDKQVLIDAIEGFTTSFGTVAGSATLRAIDAIADVNPTVARIDPAELAEGYESTASDEFVPDIVVLLTDGASVGGVPPLSAAEVAAARGIRIYTIGFGTTEPTRMVCAPEQLGTAGAGFTDEVGRATQAPRRYLVIDEPTLQGMADVTGGEYFRAENADRLVEVFDDLPSRVVAQDEPVEITVAFVMAAAVLAVAAVALSLFWNRS